MPKGKRLAALALCGSVVAVFSLLKPVKRPLLPDDCVWVEFPYGFVCLREKILEVYDAPPSSNGGVNPQEGDLVSGIKSGTNQ